MQRKGHKKITSDERDKIAQWISQKVGVREIARRLGRSHGSICAELERNAHKEAGYVAIHAQTLANERKAKARKRHPLKSDEVFAYVRCSRGYYYIFSRSFNDNHDKDFTRSTARSS